MLFRSGDSNKGSAADVVLTADTGATITAVKAWTYATPGTINTVAPATGQVGTKIVIAGASLFTGGTKVVAVTLNAVAVASIGCTQSNTKIEVVAAAGAKAASTDVVITTDIGTKITGAKKWSYLEPGAIAKLEPASGRVGTKVTISGARLRGGGAKVTAVSLGATAVGKIVSEKDTEVVVIAGNNDPTENAVAVTLTADTGATVTKAAAWTYTFNIIISVTPNAGQVGTKVSINGFRMLGGGKKVTADRKSVV